MNENLARLHDVHLFFHIGNFQAKDHNLSFFFKSQIFK
jgi:hypothetical protein